ncbi:MAG: hypothetical protein ACYDCL_14735 [Myxococcales bacterium]
MRNAIIALSALSLASTAYAGSGTSPKTRKSSTSTEDQTTQQDTSANNPSVGPEENVESDLGTGPAFSVNKRFRFELGYELHGMTVNNNLVGNGAETVVNYWYASATYYFDKNDQLTLLWGLYDFALYDPGEPDGFRADDMLLRYTHHFALPWKLGLDTSASLTAPFSFASYKMGLVTEPEVRAALTRTFAKYVTVDLRGFADYFVQTYTTVQGGSAPNPIARLGGLFSVTASLPWHPQLSIGIDVEDAAIAYYNVGSNPLSTPGEPGATGTVPGQGAETFPTYPKQPWQQEYGYDVYLSYELPKVYHVRATVQLAYAQGDPTLGYTSGLVDGVSNLYLFYPEASQVYFSLNLKY